MQTTTILRIIYIILIVINLIIFLTKYKKINFLFIYFLSSIIYYAVAIFGKLYYSYSDNLICEYNININTYIVLIINMLLIFVSTLLPEPNIVLRKKEKNNTNLNIEKFTMNIFFILCFVLSIYTVLKLNLFWNNEKFNKTELLNNTGTIIEYFKSIVMFAIVYIFTQNNIKYSKIAYVSLIFSIFVTFLLGHRSYIIIALIAIGYHYYNEKISNNNTLLQSVIKNYKIILLAVLVIFITFAIKGVTAALFDNNMVLVKSRLTNLEYYINTFKTSEPNIITTNLDTIIKNNYKLEQSSYPILITLFVPFISRFIQYTSFTYIYQETLFGVSNRASTFIGEAFANGSFLTVGLIIMLLLLLLKFTNTKLVNCKNNIIRTFILISGIDLSFYIHRNSIDYAFIRIRSYIYIVMLIYIIKIILTNLKIRKRDVSKN